jgi:hypothetical protein
MKETFYAHFLLNSKIHPSQFLGLLALLTKVRKTNYSEFSKSAKCAKTVLDNSIGILRKKVLSAFAKSALENSRSHIHFKSLFQHFIRRIC